MNRIVYVCRAKKKDTVRARLGEEHAVKGISGGAERRKTTSSNKG
jgi:hypothetical protein